MEVNDDDESEFVEGVDLTLSIRTPEALRLAEVLDGTEFHSLAVGIRRAIVQRTEVDWSEVEGL